MEKIGRRFEGKVAIVTASTQGIGYSIAERLGLEGASVVISSRRSENVENAVEKLKGNGLQVSGVVCHVANAQHRKNLIQHTVQKHGKIDVVVLTAGVNPMPGPVLSTEETAVDKLWEVNVKASLLLVQEVAPHLETGSSIIFISTASAYLPYLPLLGMYASAKAALHALTQALASEMGPNTRVNCVAAGFVPTKFSSILERKGVANEVVGRTFLKRPGTIQEIAAAVVFLASEDASFITGETLAVSGGLQPRL